MSTYLQLIVGHFANLRDPLDVALEAAELTPLVDWFQGEPIEYRETNTPYAWFELDMPDEVTAQDRALSFGRFEAHVAVVLGIGARDPGELLDKVAAYAPVLVATIEQQGFYYTVRSEGVYPGPRSTRVGTFRLVAMPFEVTGDRDYGSAS